MRQPEPEIEPDVPDWSKEPASDELLTQAIKERRRRLRDLGERRELEELLEHLQELGFGK